MTLLVRPQFRRAHDFDSNVTSSAEFDIAMSYIGIDNTGTLQERYIQVEAISGARLRLLDVVLM